MWSNPKPDAALSCVSTNDQMIQSIVVSHYTSVLTTLFRGPSIIDNRWKSSFFRLIRKPQSLDVTEKKLNWKFYENNELPFLNILLTQLLKLAFTILLIRLIYNELNWSLYRVNLPVLITHWYELVPTSLNRLEPVIKLFSQILL